MNKYKEIARAFGGDMRHYVEEYASSLDEFKEIGNNGLEVAMGRALAFHMNKQSLTQLKLDAIRKEMTDFALTYSRYAIYPINAGVLIEEVMLHLKKYLAWQTGEAVVEGNFNLHVDPVIQQAERNTAIAKTLADLIYYHAMNRDVLSGNNALPRISLLPSSAFLADIQNAWKDSHPLLAEVGGENLLAIIMVRELYKYKKYTDEGMFSVKVASAINEVTGFDFNVFQEQWQYIRRVVEMIEVGTFIELTSVTDGTSELLANIYDMQLYENNHVSKTVLAIRNLLAAAVSAELKKGEK